MSEIVTTTIGLAFGLLTGFYFERRTNKSTKAQNNQLRRQLDALRAIVHSLGGNPDAAAGPRGMPPDLPADVQARARATQDASGRVKRGELVSYFVSRGVEVDDVESAISQVCSGGIAREEGHWLHLQ